MTSGGPSSVTTLASDSEAGPPRNASQAHAAGMPPARKAAARRPSVRGPPANHRRLGRQPLDCARLGGAYACASERRITPHGYENIIDQIIHQPPGTHLW